MIDYFKILKVTEDAEPEIIKASYRALVKKYHPDNKDIPQDVSIQQMQLINEAYDVLSDRNKREKYINELRTQNGTYSSNTDKKNTFTDEESDKNELLHNKIVMVMLVVLAICFMVCIIYFGIPEMIKFFKQLGQSFNDFIKTFR